MKLQVFTSTETDATTCFSVLQSRDREHRRSTGKQGVDASGNLYQYDNYDEVAMDTDSETSSPGEDLYLLTVTVHCLVCLSGQQLILYRGVWTWSTLDG